MHTLRLKKPNMSKKVAIIGAGIAGLTLAKLLSASATVDVFEKSRGVGGRMATRKHQAFNFDHATAGFSAQSEDFRQFLTTLDPTYITRWQPKVLDLQQASYQTTSSYYIGLPGMNGICKALLGDYTLHKTTQITHIQRQETWTLTDSDNRCYQGYDWLIITSPAPQTLALLATTTPPVSWIDTLKSIQTKPCHTIMYGLKQPLELSYDIGLINNSILEKIHNNTRRPGSDQTTLVIHSSSQWAAQTLSEDEAMIKQVMTDSLRDYIKINTYSIAYQSLHTWRYAEVSKPCTHRYLVDDAQALAVCGDGFMASGVEGAYRSADFLGRYLSHRV